MTKAYQAKVSLALQNKYAFPQRQLSQNSDQRFVGRAIHVGILAGADEKNLVAGDNIGSTQSAVVLENLISQFLYSKAADSSTPSSRN